MSRVQCLISTSSCPAAMQTRERLIAAETNASDASTKAAALQQQLETAQAEVSTMFWDRLQTAAATALHWDISREV